MKVLLVYPAYPDTFWSFKHALKFISKKAAFPPLGLLTIAPMFPSHWKLKLVDLNVEPLKDKDILWSDMVCISAMLVQKESAEKVIQRCNDLKRRVVAGGPAFTTRWELFPGVDHFVLDEAEITLPRFLADLERGTPQKMYRTDERPDITRTPLPMWSLINLKKYATPLIQYSRGCPFNCEFCDIIIMNGRIPRVKTPAQMLRELGALYQTGWRGSVFIVDDNFIGNKKHVKKLLPEMIRWQRRHRYPFTFFTEASINLGDDEELMRMMSAANFNKVFIGLETPNSESLKECSKMQNTQHDLTASIRTIQKHGMQVMGGFIVGFDSDSPNIFEAQVKFIQQIGVVTAMVGVLIALPQTRLWHRLKAEGRLIKESTGENAAEGLNFVPKMGTEKLLNGYRNLITTLYSRKHYYERIQTFITYYKPSSRTKIKFEDLKALVRSIWRIGIFSRSNYLYWKLLIKTALTKFRALPEAVELAIFGHHFEKITRRLISLDENSKTYHSSIS